MSGHRVTSVVYDYSSIYICYRETNGSTGHENRKRRCGLRTTENEDRVTVPMSHVQEVPFPEYLPVNESIVLTLLE